jgi:uncharacterized protein (DUF2249 family)
MYLLIVHRGKEKAMGEQVSAGERVIDVRQIDPRHRHPVIMQLFENLPVGETLQLVADHDPKPLRFQLESRYGPQCAWAYLEEGPGSWRVRLRNIPARETSDV